KRAADGRLSRAIRPRGHRRARRDEARESLALIHALLLLRGGGAPARPLPRPAEPDRGPHPPPSSASLARMNPCNWSPLSAAHVRVDLAEVRLVQAELQEGLRGEQARGHGTLDVPDVEPEVRPVA